MRTALATVALALVAALSMAHHWGGEITWETDALFYQAKTEEMLGANGQVARERIFNGPLANYEKGLEAQSPDEPLRVSNPAWVEYSAPFYSRRLLLPFLAAELKPVLGIHALETLSLIGFCLIPALLFLLLSRRLSFGASFLASAVIILWPPLRAWSVFPLSDSFGLVFLIAGLLCALMTVERGPRWLIPWVLAVGALSITRDAAFVLVIAALGLVVTRRDRISVGLAGSAFLASLVAPMFHSVSESKLLAFVFANHNIPKDTSWGAILPEYPSNVGHMLGKYVDYAAANPQIVLLALAGVIAAFWLAPRRDTLTTLVWSTLLGYFAFLAVGPAFSAFRYELVLIPLMTFGFGQVAERVLRRISEARNARQQVAANAVPE